MRKKIIITTIAIISLTAAIAAKNHTPAANTNSIACTADMQKIHRRQNPAFPRAGKQRQRSRPECEKAGARCSRGLHRAISAGVRKYRRNQSHRK